MRKLALFLLNLLLSVILTLIVASLLSNTGADSDHTLIIAILITLSIQFSFLTTMFLMRNQQ
ncbi:hypothetical protein GCM10010918_04420 [Paenibacillus radicis (ex Gao et al. 2016)]|uniref:Uncharacterized protein n=1 Tax=Paenibacillus radicis (ex Gao et al. 2016) TaxID=1737354 RepID=A0A917GR52_9BACL|nr:hypothetical protein GCM10010918_04420 [Paenibacillus radicis (ex Gao et al. 2016)]